MLPVESFVDELERIKVAQSAMRQRIKVVPVRRVGGDPDALPGYEMRFNGRRIGGIELKRKVDGTRQVAMSEIHGGPSLGPQASVTRGSPMPAIETTPPASVEALKERIKARLAAMKKAREGLPEPATFRGMGLGKKFYGDMLRREPGNAVESDRLLSLDSTRIYQSMQRRQAARAAAGLSPTYVISQNPSAVLGETGTSTAPYTGGAFKARLKLPEHLAVPERGPVQLPTTPMAVGGRQRYQP